MLNPNGSYWSFELHQKRTVMRDPFEAEFFTGEEDSEEYWGRTDALVRETIQNSLDAGLKDNNGPVRVRFSLNKANKALGNSNAAMFFNGLLDHLEVQKFGLVKSSSIEESLSWLTIEDFNTRGLCGEPEYYSVNASNDAAKNDFFWFWRNIGRSGKSGSDIGRWGLGKTVFQASSRINTFFGLTNRHNDSRKLLMGQSITKIHTLNGSDYLPEGFFCDPEKSETIQMPFENSEFIEQFEEIFRITRKHYSGLSLVIPFPYPNLNCKEIIRSVIVHFFVPILKNELIVEVGDKISTTELSKDTIEKEAGKLDWSEKVNGKKSDPPAFNLSQWAIEHEGTDEIISLNEPEGSALPVWTEGLFSKDNLEVLRTKYESGQPVGIKIPMNIIFYDGNCSATHFHVFLQKNSSFQRGRDYFVREGMTISGVSTISANKGVNALVLVNDKTLSAMLGDAEGPAHTNWGTGEKRPDANYLKWKRRVSFVKNSVSKLIEFLTPPPAGLKNDFLQDLFSIPMHKENPVTKAENKKKESEEAGNSSLPENVDLPENLSRFVIDKISGGFAVRSGRAGDLPLGKISIWAAYDVPDGNPFKLYSRFDFDFSNHEGSLKFDHAGIKIVISNENHLEFLILKKDFFLRMTGFNIVLDLIVKAKFMEVEKES